MVELLEPMYSGIRADHLLFGSKSLGHETINFMIKETFLVRVFRCLCLLAYNFRRDSLQEFVWQSITSLHRDANRRFTSMCSRYVNARTWGGLVVVVRDSAGGSAHDEMVQVLHISRPRPIAVNGVRQIIYEKFVDIPPTTRRPYGSRTPWVSSSPRCSRTAQAANPVPALQAETTEAADAPDNNDGAEADERLPEPEDAPIDLPSIAEPAPRSEKELDAAAKIRKIILWALHRVKERKRASGKSALMPGLLELFAECRVQALAMDRAHRLYRVYFLGPLPHLLLCLDIAHTRAQKKTKEIQSELRSAEHKALETLDEQLTDVRRILKQVINIQKALKPAAEIHARRDLIGLKELAKQAVTLLKTLPFGTPPGFVEHLNIAYKGILQPWRTVTRRVVPKPTLNTDEEMY
ncbi:UvrD-like helicase ATP-binding domain-containing protein [Mycena sanguinolenta]|uniref:UvrD-like helicase ATP-binding domain-containing protein n=1 Tax=Mycena sanguinolenta TaxID=230812 RepID=A0A8H6Z188_9AGAR|nr:UvrD-like helicase ATP-binding domain-containing protein [Mycena sanguinolenta]